MNKEQLIEKNKELQAQKDELIANLNALIGAIKMNEVWLENWDNVNKEESLQP